MSWYDEPTWRTCDGCGADLPGCLNGDPDEHEYCEECAAAMAADEGEE